MSEMHTNLGKLIDLLAEEFDFVKIGIEYTISNKKRFSIHTVKQKSGKVFGLTTLVDETELDTTTDVRLFAELIKQKFAEAIKIKA